MKILAHFFLIYGVLTSFSVLGQVKSLPDKPYDLDSFSGELPFDVPLKFKQVYNSTIWVDNISVLELDKNGCPVREKKKDEFYSLVIDDLKKAYPNTEEERLRELYPNYLSTPIYQFPPKVEQKKGKTTVEFTIPPLKPNHFYAIFLVTRPSLSDIKMLLSLGTLSYTPTDSIKYYQKLGVDPDSTKCSVEGDRFIFREFILQFKPKIQEFNKVFDDELLKASVLQNLEPITEGNLSYIQRKLIDCESCSDSYKSLFRYDTLPQLINAFRHLTESDLEIKKILKGFYPLNSSILSKPVQEIDLLGRISNFDSSYVSFNELLEVVRVIRITNQSIELDQLFAQLNSLKLIFDSYNKAFINIKSALDSLITSFQENPNFADLKVINTGTNVFNLKTRTEYSLTGDFGLMYYGKNLPNSFAPYLGVHINFRYVDRDIPWRLYPNKSIAHRLSFHTGITLISLKKDGRTDNFFKNSGFTTGIGYRLSHVVRLNVGVLWFNQEDTNPLIENKSLAVTPYAGISFDLSLRSFMNGVNTFF